jgi:hypothetical protein
MNDREAYMPGVACGAEVRKEGEKWTLLLVRRADRSLRRQSSGNRF